MANVGYATLTIIPSADGFRKRLQQEVGSDIDQVGRESGRSFGDSFEQSVTPRVKEASQRIERDVSQSVSRAGSRISQFASSAGSAFASLGTSIGGAGSRLAALGPAAAAVLPAVAVAALSIVGAMVSIGSAAATAAAGIGAAFGGLAIGAKLYSQTARGEQALQQFKQGATSILSTAAQPLFDAFSAALPRVEGLLSDLQPVFRSVFGTLGEVVTGAVDEAIPALEQLGPAIGRLAEAGSGFISGFADTFGQIASNLTPALEELAPTLSAVSTALGQQLGGAVSRLLPQLVRLGERVLPALPGIMQTIAGTIGVLVNIGNLWFDVVGFVAVALQKLKVRVADANLRFQQMLNVLPKVNREQQIAAARAQKHAAQSQVAATKAQFFGRESRQLAKNLQTQKTRTQQARDALVNYRDTIINGLSSQIKYHRQVDKTAKELREGAASFNVNTKEGRQNRQAVLDQIKSARSQIKTYDEQGRTTDFLSKKTSQFTKDLLQNARQGDFSADQLQKIINKSDAIPPDVKQRINSNADSVREIIQNLIGDVRDIPTQKTINVVANVTADIADPTPSALEGTFADFRARGGPVQRGQPYVVGERGPELFVPQTSGQVVSNENMQSSGGAGAGGMTQNVTAYVSDGVDVDMLASRLGFQTRAATL